eukprot:m.201166 g.201166  ORF g.201166 m.201166 type:complete len:414 (+) comp21932_c0_seq5:170-1411(+)
MNGANVEPPAADLCLVLRSCLSCVSGAGGSRSRDILCTLQIARDKTKGKVVLLLFASKGGATEYLLEGNLNTVLTRFQAEGKCTLRFKKPSVDLFVSQADPTQLRGFLRSLHFVYTQPADVLARSIAARHSEQEQQLAHKAAEQMRTATFRDGRPLPLSFPNTVRTLDIGGHALLRRLPEAVLRLPALAVLTLSECGLREVPPSLTQALPQLRSIDFSHNDLSDFPVGVCGAHVTALNLSSNRLATVPHAIGSMAALTVLNLQSNQLRSVSGQVGRLQALRRLSLHCNHLPHVPLEIALRRSPLHTFSIYSNPFEEPAVEDQLPPRFPSLAELCAVQAVQQGLTPPDTSDIIQELFDQVHFCTVCRTACAQPRVCYVWREAARLATSFTGNGRFLTQALACSPACYRQLQRQL